MPELISPLVYRFLNPVRIGIPFPSPRTGREHMAQAGVLRERPCSEQKCEGERMVGGGAGEVGEGWSVSSGPSLGEAGKSGERTVL